MKILGRENVQRDLDLLLWTQSMTFHLASVGRYAMFQVRFGLVGWSQLRHLVFGLWTIQPICIDCIG